MNRIEAKKRSRPWLISPAWEQQFQSTRGSVDPSVNQPTPAQVAIFQRLIEGRSAKEIANEQGIKHETVRRHISNTMMRLGAGTRDQAIAILITAGLIHPVC